MDNRPYVFISYAHLDSNFVLPCVEAMSKCGINIWYDEGIQAGSEWPEYIAEKVVSCTKFLLFISKAYLESQNCKREFNFAISRKKDILSIFIEDVQLSPGMEMQLGTYQAIFRNRFESDTEFHKSLCSEQYFDICRTADGKEGTFPQSSPAPRYSSGNNYGASGNSNSNSSNNSTSGNSNNRTGDGNSVNFENVANTWKNVSSKTNSFFDSAIPAYSKNRIVAALLAIFLGSFGVHKFYLRNYMIGILYLVFCWTPIPGIIGFVEGILLLLTSNDKFNRKYNSGRK